jgi:hypothetical protein
MNAHCIHKKHNAEEVRLKARPVGRCPKARLYVIASYHARFNYVAGMLSNMYRKYGSRAMQEQLPSNALILAFWQCQNSCKQVRAAIPLPLLWG